MTPPPSVNARAERAFEPAPEGSALIEPAFVVHRPEAAEAAPLVFASPHSGRHYPPEMMAASALSAQAIRRSEDVLVDQLIAGATAHGARAITAAYARAYIDVNREPYELDETMFEDELPAFARGRSARVAAGLGSIARIVAEGQEIYRRKLTFADAKRRIETVHEPYHAALGRLVADALDDAGAVVLIDWHSMPSAAARTLSQSGDPAGAGSCDLVLGDRFGAACAPAVTALVEREFEAMGYRVARNAPYAGGYTTEFYGRPALGAHALQIEINRALYRNEATLEPHQGFARLADDLQRVFAALAALAQTRPKEAGARRRSGAIIGPPVAGPEWTPQIKTAALLQARPVHREETPRKGRSVMDASHTLCTVHRTTTQAEKSDPGCDFLLNRSVSLTGTPFT